eukprot:2497415-Rhodomonas_salina.3
MQAPPAPSAAYTAAAQATPSYHHFAGAAGAGGGAGGGGGGGAGIGASPPPPPRRQRRGGGGRGGKEVRRCGERAARRRVCRRERGRSETQPGACRPRVHTLYQRLHTGDRVCLTKKVCIELGEHGGPIEDMEVSECLDCRMASNSFR